MTSVQKKSFLYVGKSEYFVAFQTKTISDQKIVILKRSKEKMYFSRVFVVFLIVISSLAYAEEKLSDFSTENVADKKMETIKTSEITKTLNRVPMSTEKLVVDSFDVSKHKTTYAPITTTTEHSKTSIITETTKPTITEQPITTQTNIPDIKNDTILPVIDNPKESKKGVWIIRNKKNEVEVLFEAEVVFHFQYNGTDNKSVDVNIILPRNATASVKSDNNTQTLSLDWSLEFNKTNSFVIVFLKNHSDFELHKMTANIHTTPKYFVNYTNSVSLISIETNDTLYEAVPMRLSFVCNSKIKPDVKRLPNNTMMYEIEISRVKFEAFIGKEDYNACTMGVECDLDQSEWAPIIFVVILTVLTIIVLIVYITNRRRNQARGYTSM